MLKYYKHLPFPKFSISIYLLSVTVISIFSHKIWLYDKRLAHFHGHCVYTYIARFLIFVLMCPPLASFSHNFLIFLIQFHCMCCVHNEVYSRCFYHLCISIIYFNSFAKWSKLNKKEEFFPFYPKTSPNGWKISIAWYFGSFGWTLKQVPIFVLFGCVCYCSVSIGYR